jgi:Zn-dependent peptidase ImmA (M78 family)
MPNEALLMELADHGSPEKLAKCIHQHLADLALPVVVKRVAAEVGIEEIRGEEAGFEGMLIADADKRHGIIVYNRRGPIERHRFTIAHELGHLLIPSHDARYTCLERDLCTYTDRDERSRKEAEANRFAVELLMPAETFCRRMRRLGSPELDHVVILAREFGTSKEATARRFVDLAQETCAIVYSKDGRVRYCVRSDDCSPLCLRREEALPAAAALGAMQPGTVTPWFDGVPDDWVVPSRAKRATEITGHSLIQENGFAMTLVCLDEPDGD